MFYVYVLGMSNGQLYIGFTPNLKERVQKHKEGKVFSTRRYLPVRLLYYECYLAKEDAVRREKMLKKFGSTWSHLKKRIANSIKDFQGRGQC
ncbi:MAG: GIY-YIG nuclease family protein [Patescibacteria group bacterium]